MKLIIELAMSASDFSEEDANRFVVEATSATGINVEVGRPIDDEHGDGPFRTDSLSTEYFTVRIDSGEALAGAAALQHLTCGCQLTDGPCNAPIVVDSLSYSGYSHTHTADWLHWATPIHYGYGLAGTQSIFVPCAVCGKHRRIDIIAQHYAASSPEPNQGSK